MNNKEIEKKIESLEDFRFIVYPMGLALRFYPLTTLFVTFFNVVGFKSREKMNVLREAKTRIPEAFENGWTVKPLTNSVVVKSRLTNEMSLERFGFSVAGSALLSVTCTIVAARYAPRLPALVNTFGGRREGVLDMVNMFTSIFGLNLLTDVIGHTYLDTTAYVKIPIVKNKE